MNIFIRVEGNEIYLIRDICSKALLFFPKDCIFNNRIAALWVIEVGAKHESHK